jgi:hypothetical protein
MAIRITGTERVQGMMGYTLYVIEFSGGKVIRKRYSEFEALAEQLNQVAVTPTLPPKKTFSNTDPEFVAARFDALLSFLSFVF